MRLYNGHYYQLLLAELLYKNDSAQANRAELQQAVAYFDSLMAGADAPRASADNATITFLAARAHYINGVGYYENDSLVEACREYLKALETMEEQFGEKELTGKKAKFMAYIYNRLLEIFSAQFMMETTIDCCEQSLSFCKIAPTSPFGVSNTLLRLGMQYNKLGEKEKAMEYYEKAIEELPVLKGALYRDIIASKALCDYQLGMGREKPLDALRQILTEAADESERLARYIAIGDIFFEEQLYDSALIYLEPLFECNENLIHQVQVANFLRIIYDSLGYADKSDKCMRFLADQKKSEGQNKALVSQLECLYQTYLNQKQEKKAAQEKRNAVLRTVKILIPIALLVAAVIITVIRKKGEMHLINQKIEAKKEMEEKAKQHEEAMKAEKQAHRMEQAALSGRLKRSNEKLRDVSRQLEQTLAKNSLFEKESPDNYTAFLNAPVSLYIVKLVHEGQFKSKMDYMIYKESALNKEQMLTLRDAAEKYLKQFIFTMRKQYPNLTDSDMDYCYLFLLGLSEADVSALMQRAYTTVCERSRKIKGILGTEGELCPALRSLI